jgi:hypothetical protein
MTISYITIPHGRYKGKPKGILTSRDSLELIQENLGLTNLKGPKNLFFISRALLLLGIFTIEITTEGLEIKFFIAEISLLKVSLYQVFSVLRLSKKVYKLV